jgi:hypothetical protein
MTASLLPQGKQQYFDLAGNPLVGGLISTFDAGTTNPRTTWADAAQTTPNSNPIVLNARGEAVIFWSGSYKVTVKDSLSNTIYTVDGFSSPLSLTDLTQSVVGQILYPLLASEAASNSTPLAYYYEPGNVKRYGALGDGSGATPTSTGVDISSAAWNTWAGTPFLTNPAYTPPGFQAARAKPFLNSDTWDYIGCNRALWYAGSISGATFFPAGNYVINLSGTNKVQQYNGLIIMKGQEQMIYGEGPYKTTITPKENAAFFAANNVGVANYYTLFTFYRTGGPPSGIRDIGVVGPTSYGTTSKNLTAILAQNINGVTFRDLWISALDRGIGADTSSGDSHVKGITTEFCFSYSVVTDATSELSIDFCNFWASGIVANQAGVVCAGRGTVTNSRFVGFVGKSFSADSGIFSNNYVSSTVAVDYCVTFGTGGSVVSDNEITGACQTASITVSANSSIVGNKIYNTDQHACLNLGANSAAASTATNLTVMGNTFLKTNATVASDNYAITAAQSGVGFTQAATQSCLITGNTFQGRALNPLGSATLTKNTYDGVLQTALFNETLTAAGDVIAPQVMSGTVASGATVNITGLLGIGSGTTRDSQRLNLVIIRCTGSSYDGRMYALFTSKYSGAATLIATLGTQSDGGSIAVGTSGTSPTFTPTCGLGGVVTYTVNAVPLG